MKMTRAFEPLPNKIASKATRSIPEILLSGIMIGGTFVVRSDEPFVLELAIY